MPHVARLMALAIRFEKLAHSGAVGLCVARETGPRGFGQDLANHEPAQYNKRIFRRRFCEMKVEFPV